MTEDNLKRYLHQQKELMRSRVHNNPDWKYGGYEELVLDCGLAMEGTKLPDDIKQRLPKSCYHNCQKIAFEEEEYIYVEGYAIAQGLSIVVAHSWLTTSSGKAIDPTWDNTGAAYFGVPLATKWIKSFLEQRWRKNDLSILEGNYIEGYSLLKFGLPPEARYHVVR
jgi:hypothetical protein